jgi:hypothetical protein
MLYDIYMYIYIYINLYITLVLPFYVYIYSWYNLNWTLPLGGAGRLMDTCMLINILNMCYPVYT